MRILTKEWWKGQMRWTFTQKQWVKVFGIPYCLHVAALAIIELSYATSADEVRVSLWMWLVLVWAGIHFMSEHFNRDMMDFYHKWSDDVLKGWDESIAELRKVRAGLDAASELLTRKDREIAELTEKLRTYGKEKSE